MEPLWPRSKTWGLRTEVAGVATRLRLRTGLCTSTVLAGAFRAGIQVILGVYERGLRLAPERMETTF